MKLSDEDRTADKEIAEIVNELESLQLLKPNNNTDTQITNLASRLEQLSKLHPTRVQSHISEIYGFFKEVIELYQKYDRTVPYINPKFLPFDCLPRD